MVLFFRNHVLGIYFLCVCLAGGESESEVEEQEDDDDGGKFGRRGSPKRSVIGRRCFGFSSVSGRARSFLGGRGGVARSTSIWLSLFE